MSKPEVKAFIVEKVSQVRIDDLKFADYNPRKITKKQFADLKAGIKKFGMVDPIIVNQHQDRKNVIVGGHMRAKVWKELGHKEIPAVFVYLSFQEEKELNVRLNKNGGEFDWDMLANHFDIEELKDIGFEDFEMTGFGGDEEEKDAAGSGVEQEKENEKEPPRLGVLIECEDEADQKTVFHKIAAQGLNCRNLRYTEKAILK